MPVIIAVVVSGRLLLEKLFVSQPVIVEMIVMTLASYRYFLTISLFAGYSTSSGNRLALFDVTFFATIFLINV